MGFAGILLIGVGLLAYTAYQQGTSILDTLDVMPGQPKFKKLTVTSIIIIVPIILDNRRGNTGANIDKIDGSLLDGNSNILGTFLSTTPFIIKPGSTTNVQFEVAINNLQLLKQLFTLITTGKTPTIAVNGGLHTSLFGRLPFQFVYYVSQDLRVLVKSYTQGNKKPAQLTTPQKRDALIKTADNQNDSALFQSMTDGEINDVYDLIFKYKSIANAPEPLKSRLVLIGQKYNIFT